MVEAKLSLTNPSKKVRTAAGDHLIIENSVSISNIESLVHGYILNCRCEGKSPTTITTYEEHLRRFLWYCRKEDFPNEPNKLTAFHVRSFLWYVSSEPTRWGGTSLTAQRPAGKSTVNHYYRVLNTFFAWLRHEGLVSDNPMSYVRTPNIERKVVQALTSAEVKCLLKACSGKTVLEVRNRAIVFILLDCGLRIQELAQLALDDVSMNTGTILVRNGKGGKQRTVRIGNLAQKALWRYVNIHRRNTSKTLFVDRTGQPLSVNGAKIIIKRLGKKAGLKVHPHKLRHTFAINFLRAGGDAFSLQYLLGHSTLQMTQRYIQSLNAEDAINAHKKFSPLDNMT